MQRNHWSDADAVWNVLACNKDRAQSLRVLLSRPTFNPNAVNEAGLTPLKAAVVCGCGEEVQILLQAGATCDKTIIDFAEGRYPHKPCVAQVLRAWHAREFAEKVMLEIAQELESTSGAST